MNSTQEKKRPLAAWAVWWSACRLKSKNPKVRRKAIERLGSQQSARGVSLLAASLAEDKNAQVRSAAAKALGGNQSDQATVLLKAALRNSRSEVRRAAALGLAYSSDDWAIKALVGALRDPDPDVRASAATALRRLNWRAGTQEEQALFDVASGNTRAAALKGDAALSSLLIELQHHFSCKRRAAAEALETVSDPKRVRPLLRATNDDDPSVRVWAAHALSQENAHEVRASFGKLLRNPNAHVRLAAAQALASRGDPAERSCFVELLRDSNFEVRLTAVQFLAKFPDPQNTQALLSVLGDADCDVRHAAAKALGILRSPYAMESLVVALGDEDRLVRQAAEASLAQIDPDWLNSAAAQRAIGGLEAAQQKCPAWVRSTIGQVLARLRAQSPIPSTTATGQVWIRM